MIERVHIVYMHTQNYQVLKRTTVDISFSIVMHNVGYHSENPLIKGPQTFGFWLTCIATTKSIHGFNYYTQIDGSSLLDKKIK